MSDLIRISRLQLDTHIGVPDSERATAQRLLVSVEIETDLRASAQSDDVADTIDYALVAQALQGVAAERPRRLIETLAEELAQTVLSFNGVQRVTILLEKFILPNTENVAVRVTRPHPSAAL